MITDAGERVRARRLGGVAWCFADEATPATDAVLDRLGQEEAAAPALWRLEVANALAMAERRGRLSPAGLTRCVALLQQLVVAIDGEGSERAFRELLDLARSERLTVYDAAYLELALRLGLPLASRMSDCAGPQRGWVLRCSAYNWRSAAESRHAHKAAA